jgi:hypothetical protein
VDVTGPARAALAVVLLVGSAARAQDNFEIQVYDSETAPRGAVGLEVHLNVFAQGVRQAAGVELPTDRVTHFTLEPHVGLARWCEAGAYLQTALRPDGNFDYAGVKLRYKMRVPRRFAGVVGLALNIELSSVPAIYEPPELGGELRPILDAELGRIYLSINPILALELRGRLAGHPQLEPAAQLLVRAVGALQVGLEYYAALGPIDAPLPAADEVHRLFVVGQYGRGGLGINLGVGYGLAAGERWIVKTILSGELPP